ncbi:hypothetical protein G5C65_25185, partial [Streptomyces sp. SB3404]|nr:hypothetical protein [Streptomyces boncukensis]
PSARPASGDTPREARIDHYREQHQQARDDTAPIARGAEDEGEPGRPAPLPRRRRGAPVLISDHGRRVRTDQDEDEDEDGIGAGDGAVPVRPDPAERPATVGGLPRRVRQASLARQLRTEPPAAGPPPAQGADRTGDRGGGGEAERDAEAVRSRMASLQRGWERGRRENGPGPAADAGHSSGEPAQGTTPEGNGR